MPAEGSEFAAVFRVAASLASRGEKITADGILLYRSELEELLDEVTGLCSSAKAQAANSSRSAWHDWLRAGLDKGGRVAHAALKDPIGWSTTTTMSSNGIIVADPKHLLKADGG